MTIGEWTQERFNLLGYPYPKGIEAELFKDIDPGEEYSEELQEKVETGLVGIIPYLMNAPQSVSESGFSLSRQKLTELYKFLLNKYGLDDAYGILNTIEDKTDVW